MKKKFKKTITMLACGLLISSGVLGVTFSDTSTLIANAAVVSPESPSGRCGRYVTWVLNKSTGVVTISGYGYMDDYLPNRDLAQYKLYIKSVIIEYGVGNIGKEAFASCEILEKISIPISVSMIDPTAFINSKNITIYGENNSYAQYYADFYSINFGGKCGQNGTWSFNKSTGAVTISGTSTIEDNFIDKYCSRYRNKIKSIEIKDGVVSIGNFAFRGCFELTSVIIPNSIKTIGDNAFEGCLKLQNIIIPSTVTSIGRLAFIECDNLTIYGESNGYAENYAKLNWINFQSSTTPTFKYGDVNGDGSVDADDYALVRDFYLGNFVEFPSKYGKLAADVSGDGKVLLNDAALIRDYIIGRINKFPAETIK